MLAIQKPDIVPAIGHALAVMARSDLVPKKCHVRMAASNLNRNR